MLGLFVIPDLEQFLQIRVMSNEMAEFELVFTPHERSLKVLNFLCQLSRPCKVHENGFGYRKSCKLDDSVIKSPCIKSRSCHYAQLIVSFRTSVSVFF